MYESKAMVLTIKATSRAAIKVKDNFYTVEYSEERSVPDMDDVNIDAERTMLWDDVNKVVDDQCASIVETFTTK